MIISIVFHLQDKVQSDVWLSCRQDGELTKFSLCFGKRQGETISQNYHCCCKNGLELVALLPKLLDGQRKQTRHTEMFHGKSALLFLKHVDKFTLKRAAKDFFFSP